MNLNYSFNRLRFQANWRICRRWTEPRRLSTWMASSRRQTFPFTNSSPDRKWRTRRKSCKKALLLTLFYAIQRFSIISLSDQEICSNWKLSKPWIALLIFIVNSIVLFFYKLQQNITFIFRRLLHISRTEDGRIIKRVKEEEEDEDEKPGTSGTSRHRDWDRDVKAEPPDEGVCWFLKILLWDQAYCCHEE